MSRSGRHSGLRRATPETITGSPGFIEELKPDQWTIPYLALIVYAFGMVTGRLPVGTAAVVIGLVALLFSPYKVRLAPPVVWMTILLAWASASYFFSPFQDQVAESLFHLLKLVLVAFLTTNAVRTRRQAIFFLFVVSVFFVLYPIRGTLLNYFVLGYTHFGRAVGAGIYENSNDLAALTLLQLSIAVSMFIGLRSQMARLGALLVSFCMALVIVLTQSRGVFLGSLAFVALIISAEKRKLRLILILFSAVALVAMLVPSSTFERFGRFASVLVGDTSIDSADAEGSAAGRSDIYRIALTVSKDHPVFGIGLGAYPLANEQYAARMPDIVKVSRGRIDAHSTYLGTFAEIGLPGLAILLLFYRSIFIYLRAIRDKFKNIDRRTYMQLSVIIGGLVGFYVAATVGSYKGLAMTYVHFCAIWVLANTMQSESLTSPPPADKRENLRADKWSRAE